MQQWLRALPQPIAVFHPSAPTRRAVWDKRKEFIVSYKATAMRTSAHYRCQMRMTRPLLRSSEPTVRFHVLACIKLRCLLETFPYVLVECDHITLQAQPLTRSAVWGAGMCVRAKTDLSDALRLLPTCYIQCTHRRIPATATTHGMHSKDE
jgi:hypothetical protein